MTRDKNAGHPQGAQPSDTEELVGDTAASEKLTDAKRVQPPERDSRPESRPVTGGANIPRGTDEHSGRESGGGMHAATSGESSDASQRGGVERETPEGGVERE